MLSWRDKLPPLKALPIILRKMPQMYWLQMRKDYHGALKLGRQMMGSAELKRIGYEGHQPSGRDVFVCTYSKSGTYWMLQLVTQIASRGAAEFEHIHDVVPWPEIHLPGIVNLRTPTWEASQTGMRAIKTHAEAPFVPYGPEAKYVVVLRDPKDVLISAYYFSDSIMPGMTSIGLEAWTEAFMRGEVPYGSWPEQVAGFWPWRERDNVMLTTYGEMKSGLEAVVRRVAALMGVELSPSELAAVVERGSFAHMKREEHKFRPPVPSPERDRVELLRKGQTGDAKLLLTDEQRARVDEAMKRGLRELGSDFPYDEYFPA